MNRSFIVVPEDIATDRAGDAVDVLSHLAYRLEDHETHAALTRARIERAIGFLVHCLQYERGVSVLHAATHGDRMRHERATARTETDRSIVSLLQLVTGLESVAVAECAPSADTFHALSAAIRILQSARQEPPLETSEARASACFKACTTAISHLLHAVRLLGGAEVNPEQADRNLARYLVVCSKELAGRERVLGALRRLPRTGIAAELDCETDELSRLQADYLARLPDLLNGEDVNIWRRAASDGVHNEVALLRSAGDLTDWQGWFSTSTRRIEVLRTLELALLTPHTDAVRRSSTREVIHVEEPPDVLIDAVALAESRSAPGTTLLSPETEAVIAAQVLRIEQLEVELASLRNLTREQDTINNAVHCLVTHRHLDADQAHQLLRRMAMNERRSLPDMAQCVVRLFNRT